MTTDGYYTELTANHSLFEFDSEESDRLRMIR